MRFLIAAVLLVSSAAAADAKAVWRHYPSFVRSAAFAYAGPGNVLWRVYRPHAAPRKQTAKSSPFVTPPRPGVATPAPMVLLAPNIVAKPRMTPPPPAPTPSAAARPAEPMTMAKAPDAPASISVAEPAQAPTGTGWVKALVAAVITAIAVTMVVSGFARRRRAGAASA